ncbi:MAG TPA: penicillin-binding protein activator LpoB [Pirellulales bacterium]|nr:penicillin-binding protein activator LpoB [Pirellulales bacterium]
MERRTFISTGMLTLAGCWLTGCRHNQYAKVMHPGDQEMVGSHQAGGETYKPLIDEAVSKLLGRHAAERQVGPNGLPPPPLRICFVAVENKSAEEIGDFKDQIYEQIDSRILESHVFQPISKRFVDAGLLQTRLRPDLLMVPENMRSFAATLEQQGQPFDYMLYATITSGTTHENKDYQRDYLLTMELVNIHDGQYDKQSATLSKGYFHSRLSRFGSTAH